jgi:hypothetical protein
MRSICVSLVLVSALATMTATVGHAAPPPGKSDVATDKARELHIEADALYAQGQYARARVSYLAAWALKKHWQIAGSLGDTEVKLGLYRDAAEHLAYYMRLSPNQPPSPEAQKLFREACSRIGTLLITVDVSGAEVAVDGKVVGNAPLEDPVFVEPGHHTIEARLSAKLVTADLDIAGGGKRTVPIALTATAERTGPSVPVIVTGAAVAGVALAAGIGFLVGAGSKGSSAQSEAAAIAASGHTCVAGASYDARCDGLHSTAATGDTMNRAGIGLLMGAGIVAAGTVVYSLVPRAGATAPRTGTVHVVPALAPGYSGLSFSGTF